MREVVEYAESMLEECTQLYVKVYSQAPWNEEWESWECIREYFKNHYLNNYFLGVIVKQDEKIVGVSIGFLKPWIKGFEYYIDEFFVDASMHGQGVGTQLMTGVKNIAKAKNAPAIILNTIRGYPSQNFYEKQGFIVDERLVILYTELE